MRGPCSSWRVASPHPGWKNSSELIDLGVTHDIINKAGAWYSYGKDRIGQGKEKVREFLKENPDVAADIEKQLRDKLLAPKRKEKLSVVGDDVPDTESVA